MNEKDYITQSEEKGIINISEEVIASIASAAARDVDGVAGMSASFSAEFAEKLGKKNTAKGVKIATEEDGILINVSVLVKYGCTIREVASAVQTAVTDAVSGMTGFTVKQVNVNIAGVAFEKE